MTRRPPVVLRLIEYMRMLVIGAKGGIVNISLKKASRALEIGRAEAAAVKAALDALASLGLLEVADGKPRYVLRRGSPLWAALEANHVELVAAVAAKCSKPRRRRRP